MRAFLAIELPDDVRAELVDAQTRLRERMPAGAIGWTPPTNWHLTLAFLGEVADPAPVVAAAREACAGAGPIELSLGALGTFGDRVVWAGLEGPGRPALVALAGRLARACAALGFELDDRPYAPHITLARARDGGRGGRGRRDRRGGAGRPKGREHAGVIAVVRATTAPAPLAFTAREVVLFESQLGGPKPATYVPHARVPLDEVRGDTREDPERP